MHEGAIIDVIDIDVEKNAACEFLAVGREGYGPNRFIELNGVDLSPFHRVNAHISTTDRNESIIRRDGNRKAGPLVSPFSDKLMRLNVNVPHFDPPTGVTADDIDAISGHSKILHFARVHRSPFLHPVFQIPDLHCSVLRAADDSSVREIRDPLDSTMMHQAHRL